MEYFGDNSHKFLNWNVIHGSFPIPKDDLCDETDKKLTTTAAYPCMYHVVITDHAGTPDEFVVELVQTFFGKSALESRAISMQIHHEAEACCGVYTRDVAETKVMQVMEAVHRHRYTLKCYMRKDPTHVIKKP